MAIDNNNSIRMNIVSNFDDKGIREAETALERMNSKFSKLLEKFDNDSMKSAEKIAKNEIFYSKKTQKEMITLDNIHKKFRQTFGKMKMDLLGVGFMFMNLGNTIKALFQPTDNLIGINYEMARLVGGDLYNSLLEITATFMEFALTLLDLAGPTIEWLCGLLTQAMEDFDKLPTPMKEFIGQIVGLSIVLAPVIGFLSFMGVGLLSLIDLLFGAGTVATGFGAIISTVFTPVTIVLAGTIAIAWEFYEAWDMIFNKKAPEDLDVFQKSMVTIGGFVIFILQEIVSGLQWMYYSGVEILDNLSAEFWKFVNNALAAMAELFSKLELLPVVGGLFAGATGGLTTAAQAAADTYIAALLAATEASTNKVAAGEAFMGGNWENYQKGLSTLWSNANSTSGGTEAAGPDLSRGKGPQGSVVNTTNNYYYVNDEAYNDKKATWGALG